MISLDSPPEIEGDSQACYTDKRKNKAEKEKQSIVTQDNKSNCKFEYNGSTVDLRLSPKVQKYTKFFIGKGKMGSNESGLKMFISHFAALVRNDKKKHAPFVMYLSNYESANNHSHDTNILFLKNVLFLDHDVQRTLTDSQENRTAHFCVTLL